jgi:hypothetical protein
VNNPRNDVDADRFEFTQSQSLGMIRPATAASFLIKLNKKDFK